MKIVFSPRKSLADASRSVEMPATRVVVVFIGALR